MKSNKISLLSGISFLILGTIIFLKPDAVVKFISYAFGIILFLIGLYSVISYTINDRRSGIVNRNEFAFGITAIILGILFICLSSTIELLLRIFVGIWVLLSGLKKINDSFFIKIKDSKFIAIIVLGILMICAGIYIIFVSNLALSIIGLFMMIYGIVDIISFFVYKDKLLIKEATIIKENN